MVAVNYVMRKKMGIKEKSEGILNIKHRIAILFALVLSLSLRILLTVWLKVQAGLGI